MTDKLIDMTTKKRHNLHRCFYCDHSRFPQGKVIMPFDKYARKTEKGDFICGTCVNEMSRKIIEGMQRHSERI